MKKISEYKHGQITIHPNYIAIPINIIDMTIEGAEEFNEIYRWVLSTTYNQIIRTPSGSISTKTMLPAYDVRCTNACVELTICDINGQFRFQFRTELEKRGSRAFSGRQAFKRFKKILKKYDIDLEAYKNDEGMKIKQTIEKPLIKLTIADNQRITFNNVQHVDFHASYPAGLVNTHPEFKQCIEDLYNKRKEDEWFKAILNFSIGFMQSKYGCGAKYSHLAKDAIADNNRRVVELSQKITAHGGVILCYNTDGFWFVGNNDYHDDNEGDGLGQWHYDHVNCMFRAKSAGCYEYIENGIYTPVVRGRTNYDTVNPREKWIWGDIWREDCVPIKYYFVEGEGIKYEKV